MLMRTNKGQFTKNTHWRSVKPYWDREWLYHEYITLGKSTSEIASQFGCRDTNIQYFLSKFGIQTRTVSEARRLKYWGACGIDNPMYNRKGELNPNWKGGISAERQAFYSSAEWKEACSFVWMRDEATCQRCGMKSREGLPFHVHHVISFKNRILRADVSNLILLCEVCHGFVHSKRNTNSDFIERG